MVGTVLRRQAQVYLPASYAVRVGKEQTTDL